MLLVAGGARELVLVGQDIARYGVDLTPRTDLASLVRGLDGLPGDFRIRLMYLQPDGVTDSLLEAIADGRKVCRYLDLPLQHASARVLRAMRRGGSAERHLDLVGRIRDALPDVSLRTTVMSGFPGEQEADHAELEQFIADAAFDYVGVFAFSPEEGTVAEGLPGQVTPEIALERAQRLRDIADEVGFERAARLVGTSQRVLVEGAEDGETFGRTCGQAPDVDGITIIDGEGAVGEFADVRIIDSAGYDLIGAPL
jgi:ribosomal protein S12 methylthiotransferase